MKHLVIIGAGGYGRQVYNIAIESDGYLRDYDVKGFIDNLYDSMDSKYKGYPSIISKISDYKIEQDDVFICAIGDVNLKRKFISLIEDRGGQFITLIHPSVRFGSNVSIGKGCVIGHNTFVDSDTKIMDFVSIQANVVIGHDNIIGSMAMIDCFSFTGGGCVLEDYVTMHTRATIIPQRVIGANSTINACSLVIRDVNPNAIMMGNPAKQLLVPQK